MAEAIAKADFPGNGEEFLTIKEGDLIKLTSFEVYIGDSRWFRAYLNGKHGYVPDYMIDIRPLKWFWGGAITGKEAEEYLSKPQSKTFLIRETPPDSFHFYLSYKRKDDGRVFHFKIFSTAAGMNFYFFKEFKRTKMFRSLNELAIYVERSAWYSSPFWKPYEDQEEKYQKQLQKRRKWSPNV